MTEHERFDELIIIYFHQSDDVNGLYVRSTPVTVHREADIVIARGRADRDSRARELSAEELACGGLPRMTAVHS